MMSRATGSCMTLYVQNRGYSLGGVSETLEHGPELFGFMFVVGAAGAPGLLTSACLATHVAPALVSRTYNWWGRALVYLVFRIKAGRRIKVTQGSRVVVAKPW